MFLLDTNICIYLIKAHPKSVVDNIEKYKPFQIKISSVTVAELEYGVFKSEHKDKNRQILLKFLSPFDILHFDDRDAEYYGRIRAYLENAGILIGPYDMQIAAQALSKDLILVSNNVREFDRVPNLKLENWV